MGWASLCAGWCRLQEHEALCKKDEVVHEILAPQSATTMSRCRLVDVHCKESACVCEPVQVLREIMTSRYEGARGVCEKVKALCEEMKVLREISYVVRGKPDVTYFRHCIRFPARTADGATSRSQLRCQLWYLRNVARRRVRRP